MRRILAALAVFGLSIGLVFAGFLFASPAQAAQDPPATRPASPGPTYRWGASVAALDSACWGTNPADPTNHGGGWAINGASDNTWGVGPSLPNPASGSIRPSNATAGGAFRVFEPCFGTAYDGALQVVVVGGYFPFTGDVFTPGAGYGTHYPADGSDRLVICQSNEWDTHPTAYIGTVAGDIIAGATPFPLPTDRPSGGFPMANANRLNCPYVVQVIFTVCSFNNDTGRSRFGADFYTCERLVWTADSWFKKDVYNGDTGEVALCKVAISSSTDCNYLLPPGYVDGANISICDGAPAAEWLNWDWLPAWIGHYARCLTVPAGGWDPDHVLSGAIDGSALVQIATVVNSAVASFDLGSGGCGPLVPSSGSVFQGKFSLDTCTWSSWGNPIRYALSFFVIVLGAWAIIGFLIDTILSIPNKKTNKPLDSE